MGTGPSAFEAGPLAMAKLPWERKSYAGGTREPSLGLGDGPDATGGSKETRIRDPGG